MNITLEIDWSEIPNAYRKSLESIAKRWEVEASKAIDKAIDEFLPQFKDGVEKVYKQSVENFYNSYSPHYYARSGDLYNLLEVDTSNRSYNIILHDEKLEPSNDGISSSSLYDIVVEGGWHGGAPSGPNHPSPGTPYWRAPPPYYTHWYTPAAESTSIFESFQEKYDTYLVEATNLLQEIEQRYLDNIRL